MIATAADVSTTRLRRVGSVADNQVLRWLIAAGGSATATATAEKTPGLSNSSGI
jgi:hypothetical protein